MTSEQNTPLPADDAGAAQRLSADLNGSRVAPKPNYLDKSSFNTSWLTLRFKNSLIEKSFLHYIYYRGSHTIVFVALLFVAFSLGLSLVEPMGNTPIIVSIVALSIQAVITCLDLLFFFAFDAALIPQLHDYASIASLCVLQVLGNYLMYRLFTVCEHHGALVFAREDSDEERHNVCVECFWPLPFLLSCIPVFLGHPRFPESVFLAVVGYVTMFALRGNGVESTSETVIRLLGRFLFTVMILVMQYLCESVFRKWFEVFVVFVAQEERLAKNCEEMEEYLGTVVHAPPTGAPRISISSNCTVLLVDMQLSRWLQEDKLRVVVLDKLLLRIQHLRTEMGCIQQLHRCGDTIVAASNLATANNNHADNACAFALLCTDIISSVEHPPEYRCAVSTGAAAETVVGCWHAAAGAPLDDVERLSKAMKKNCIVVTEATKVEVNNALYQFSPAKDDGLLSAPVFYLGADASFFTSATATIARRANAATPSTHAPTPLPTDPNDVLVPIASRLEAIVISLRETAHAVAPHTATQIAAVRERSVNDGYHLLSPIVDAEQPFTEVLQEQYNEFVEQDSAGLHAAATFLVLPFLLTILHLSDKLSRSSDFGLGGLALMIGAAVVEFGRVCLVTNIIAPYGGRANFPIEVVMLLGESFCTYFGAALVRASFIGQNLFYLSALLGPALCLGMWKMPWYYGGAAATLFLNVPLIAASASRNVGFPTLFFVFVPVIVALVFESLRRRELLRRRSFVASTNSTRAVENLRRQEELYHSVLQASVPRPFIDFVVNKSHLEPSAKKGSVLHQFEKLIVVAVRVTCQTKTDLPKDLLNKLLDGVAAINEIMSGVKTLCITRRSSTDALLIGPLSEDATKQNEASVSDARLSMAMAEASEIIARIAAHAPPVASYSLWCGADVGSAIGVLAVQRFPPYLIFGQTVLNAVSLCSGDSAAVLSSSTNAQCHVAKGPNGPRCTVSSAFVGYMEETRKYRPGVFSLPGTKAGSASALGTPVHRPHASALPTGATPPNPLLPPSLSSSDDAFGSGAGQQPTSRFVLPLS